MKWREKISVLQFNLISRGNITSLWPCNCIFGALYSLIHFVWAFSREIFGFRGFSWEKFLFDFRWKIFKAFHHNFLVCFEQTLKAFFQGPTLLISRHQKHGTKSVYNGQLSTRFLYCYQPWLRLQLSLVIYAFKLFINFLSHNFFNGCQVATTSLLSA